MMKNYLKKLGFIVSLLFASASFSQYCTPTVPVSTSSYINNLKLSSTATSTGDILNRASTNIDFDDITDTDINLISSTAYRFDIGVGDPGLTTHKRVHVWIDLNRDGDFEDAGELIFSWSGANTGGNLGFSNQI